MRKNFLLSLFLFFVLHARAQQEDLFPDATEMFDSSMVSDFSELSAKHTFEPFSKNETVNEQRLKIASGIGNHKGAGVAANNLGWIAMNKKNYDEALLYFKRASDEFTQGKSEKGMAGTLSEIGMVYRVKGDNTSALTNYTQALALMKKNKLQRGTAAVMNALAQIYSSDKDHEKALEYFKGALKEFSSLGNTHAASDANIRIGEELISTGKEDEALPFLTTALKQKDGGDHRGKAIALRDIGIIHLRKNDYTKALDFFQQSLSESHQLQVLKLVRDTYLKLFAESQVAGEKNKEQLFNKQYHLYKDSVQTLLGSRALSPDSMAKEFAEKDLITDLVNKKKDEGIKNLDAQQIETSQKMTDAELERLKTEQAIAELSKAKEMDDIADHEREDQIQQLQKEKVQQQLALSQKQLEQTHQQQLIYILLGVAGLVLVSLGFTYNRYRNNRKSHEALDKAYAELSSTHARLKNTQTQLVHSEKMASLGQLTAGIAHEIQNPLNFVNNFSELSNELIDEVRTTTDEEERNQILDDLKNNLSKINHHGKRADSIVKNMLQHSRAGTNEKLPVDINRLCEEYLNLAYHGMRANDSAFNCAMEKQLDENLGRVNVIPQDISRVLLNLFNNALYAVKEKSLHSENGEERETDNKKQKPYKPLVSVITQKLNHSILIRVRDNGGGIPDDVKAKIFQPFFTTKPTGEGTGLGLSLSYDIVKAHGGEIEVNTDRGEGTEFLIRLPI